MISILVLLKLLPWRQIALGLALGAALHFGWAAFTGHYINLGAAQERAVWQTAEAKRQQQEEQARLQAEQKARAEELRKAKENERVAKEQAAREAQLLAAADAASRRAGGLQRTIQALNARDRERALSAQPDASALADEAARARGLLGQCSIRYAGMAERAARYASQVMGLQDYITAINPDATTTPEAAQ